MMNGCSRFGSFSRVVGSVSDAGTWERACSPNADLPCDVVELRVDSLAPDFNVEKISVQSCPKPLLLTLRHIREGGGRAMPEEERMALALELLPSAAYLDWEIACLDHARHLIDAAHEARVKLVASYHDFERVPSAALLHDLERRARGCGADIVKFAFRLHSAEDLLAGVDLLKHASGPLAVMGMGALGPVSRLLYAQHGSVFVYGYLGEKPTAPGQWSARLCMEALAGLVDVCR